MIKGSEVVLGAKYVETLHNREGVATASIRYLTGCDQVKLERLDKEGKVDEFWVDVPFIEEAAQNEEPVQPPEKGSEGGPGDHPPRREGPSR